MAFSKQQRIEIHSKFGGKCAYCGAETQLKDMQVDHIIPQSFYLGHVKNKFRVPLFLSHLTENDLKNGFVAGVFETYDFSIKSITLNNGVLKIDFMNQNFTLESLSSAESSVFIHSVRKTALQFPEIEKIQFPNGMIIGIKNPNDTQM